MRRCRSVVAVTVLISTAISLWLPQTNWSVLVWSWRRSGERRSTCGSWRWGVVLPSLVSPPCVHVLVSFPCPNIDASARDRRFVWDVSWGCGTLGRLAVVVVAVVVNAGGHARRGQGRVVHVDGCRRRHRAARRHYGCRIWWRLCSRWVPPLPLDERSVACLVVRFVCVPVTRQLWCDRSCSPPPWPHVYPVDSGGQGVVRHGHGCRRDLQARDDHCRGDVRVHQRQLRHRRAARRRRGGRGWRQCWRYHRCY